MEIALVMWLALVFTGYSILFKKWDSEYHNTDSFDAMIKRSNNA